MLTSFLANREFGFECFPNRKWVFSDSEKEVFRFGFLHVRRGPWEDSEIYSVTTDLLEPFEEPEREFRKRNKKKSKANKVRPRALIFEMGDETPMWIARRAAPTVPTNPITKPNLNKEIPGKLLHMIKDLTFDGKKR
ncbi:hypothetical protein OSB04_002929 [Centaurea solstitialis]|uniref:Uncharacterized protein n=1 Tax=Centaurea solstitialis TaxID=347529 RepID=A0AA38UBX5_9ASTR|nr:hypothetical protein OSB04_002929 [Centaurea solstitialis]